ncbi:hypothetical protein [Nocardioides abyssi]|uniref:Uncharacterized protein n=1 Tax=Nocardioides abyssi TaxID=3058370 RepID=A0ABT8EYR7_9ACTN|nr:hypothetical protein [Nocardioides abyssi]MDN4163332.1 hypothetical protein [Nocardioides abyssi]
MKTILAAAGAVVLLVVAGPAGATRPPSLEMSSPTTFEADRPLELRLKLRGTPQVPTAGSLRLVVRQSGAVLWSKTKPLNDHRAAQFVVRPLPAGKYAVVAKHLPHEDSTLPFMKTRRTLVLE